MINFTKIKWKGKREFFLAQGQVAIILLIAFIGNNWPYSYPRNDNHYPQIFWTMNVALLVAAVCTVKREPSDRVTILSRHQTEEWKGWMQWAFIMYHYYRVYNVYNEIRVFVSAYVWMTGFGNFLYFDKKRDFSLERAVSMWIRINYLPLLLCAFVRVPLELFYIVPLHTAGFFITFATCYLGDVLEKKMGMPYWKSRGTAVFVACLVHVIFYETSLKDELLLFGQEGSKEYHFRFQSDKYTALVGIFNGLMWKKCTDFATWAYGTEGVDRPQVAWGQRALGLLLILGWYFCFGHIQDKYVYNPLHPYVFFLPVYGWLMIRNSSKYLTEVHSTTLDFFGKITLETYTLQFHLFMCKNVQHIPLLIPGSGAEGPLILKTFNMLLCGIILVSVAVWARTVTVTTQATLVELVKELCRTDEASNESPDDDGKSSGEELSRLVKKESGADLELRETGAKTTKVEVV